LDSAQPIEIPPEVYKILNPDERLAIFYAKGHFSLVGGWLNSLARELRESHEELPVRAYSWANQQVKTLADFPKSGGYRTDPLVERLRRVHRQPKVDLYKRFFTQVEDISDRVGQLHPNSKTVERIYQSITSSY